MQSVVYRATLIGATLVKIIDEYWLFEAKRSKRHWQTPIGECKKDYIVFDRFNGRSTSFTLPDEMARDEKRMNRLIKKAIKALSVPLK